MQTQRYERVFIAVHLLSDLRHDFSGEQVCTGGAAQKPPFKVDLAAIVAP